MNAVNGEVRTVRCTAHPCRQVKNESNNWFIVWADDPRGMFHCVEYSEEMFREIGVDQARPVCGPACGQRMYERFLSGGRV